jgi:hypothetical protein
MSDVWGDGDKWGGDDEWYISREHTIMNALKSALEGITTANGFGTDIAEAIESPAVLVDVPNRPAIRFYSDYDKRADDSFGRSKKDLHVWIWGYVDAEPEQWDNLRKMKADMEKCLSQDSTWPYRPETDIKGFNNFFGGVRKTIGIIELELVVSFDYPFAEL